MSVLIKCMKMPKTCRNCLLQDRLTFECRMNGKYYNWGLTERPSDCPLVDVREDMDVVDLACWYDKNILYPKRIEGKT